MRINECVMCTNFGDRTSHDRELTHNKHKKTAIFGLKINSPITQKPRGVQN